MGERNRPRHPSSSLYTPGAEFVTWASTPSHPPDLPSFPKGNFRILKASQNIVIESTPAHPCCHSFSPLRSLCTASSGFTWSRLHRTRAHPMSTRSPANNIRARRRTDGLNGKQSNDSAGSTSSGRSTVSQIRNMNRDLCGVYPHQVRP